jgi:hypothetical protein
MRTTLRILALPVLLLAVTLLAFGFTRAPAPGADVATPAEMVRSYETLADAILAVKHTEENLVRAILAGGWAHARSAHGQAVEALSGGNRDAARSALETLAALVAQLGSEGDNAVAAVRKRLLEGGHHHNASGEAQGIYDEGFVVVTREAKKALLDASKAIGQAAATGDRAALDKAWAQAEATVKSLSLAGR